MFKELELYILELEEQAKVYLGIVKSCQELYSRTLWSNEKGVRMSAEDNLSKAYSDYVKTLRVLKRLKSIRDSWS